MVLGAALLASQHLRFEFPFGFDPEQSAAADVPRPRALEPSAAERLARIDARLRLPPDRRAIAAVDRMLSS